MTARALVGNAASRRQVDAAGVSVKQQELRDQDDLRQLMSTASGRRFVWRILGHTGLYESCTVQSSEIYVRSGRRDVGLWLFAQVTSLCPTEYLQMQKEAARLEESIGATTSTTEESDES